MLDFRRITKNMSGNSMERSGDRSSKFDLLKIITFNLKNSLINFEYIF